MKTPQLSTAEREELVRFLTEVAEPPTRVLANEGAPTDEEEAVGQRLRGLAGEAARHPERLVSVTTTDVEEDAELFRGVLLDDDEVVRRDV